MTDSGRRRALLAWYDRAHRDLPWRRERDPYRIWVSEVMLQQTRVEAVVPYYRRFLTEFPTLDALADAPVERVLARWAGLGYYRRARALHAAVRECKERYGGAVPRGESDFGTLQGVGPYTCAAVLSIAYGAPLAVVDGNVVRVLARLDGVPGHAKSRALEATVRARAKELLDRKRPGDSNQALMELGATICTPQRPRCVVCPWAAGCVAGASGEPERWPQPAPRAVVKQVLWAAVVVRRRGRVLLRQRQEGGRMGGMWELPWCVGPVVGLAANSGLRLTPGAHLGRVGHSILDERIALDVYDAELSGARPRSRWAWVRPGQLDNYAFSGIWRKALRLAAR